MQDDRHHNGDHLTHDTQGTFSEPLPFDCIIPCAGLSSRMDGWKPMKEYRGRPIILNSIDNALAACTRVLLITGFRAGELEEKIKDEYSAEGRVICVRNIHYELGMFSSIQTGAHHVLSEWFFVALGDMPAIPPALYFSLADLRNSMHAAPSTGVHTADTANSDAQPGIPYTSTPLSSNEDTHISEDICRKDIEIGKQYDIIRPTFHKRPAHPVLLRQTVIESLCNLPSNANMQKMFARHQDKTGRGVLEIEMNEPGSLYDVDTEEDLLKKGL